MRQANTSKTQSASGTWVRHYTVILVLLVLLIVLLLVSIIVLVLLWLVLLLLSFASITPSTIVTIIISIVISSILEPLGGVLGPCWDLLEASWGPLGGLLEASVFRRKSVGIRFCYACKLENLIFPKCSKNIVKNKEKWGGQKPVWAGNGKRVSMRWPPYKDITK